jgi:bis(5'-nucleosyl)-tetraphosphatase (symmetrical)
MATYAIGDIQGCYSELMTLLDRVAFEPASDQLWICGDMVNRGPESLAVLRFLYQHRRAVSAVLGNHDLHLLAIAYGIRQTKRSDTLQTILDASDRDELLDWLRRQPLYHCNNDYLMVHAGVAPHWNTEIVARLAAEVSVALKGDQVTGFLANMYGNEPAAWRDDLTDYARLRCITNHLTRMRICDVNGCLDLEYKFGLDAIPAGFYPWFQHPQRRTDDRKIIFGHWAALQGYRSTTAFGIDTGCVWGGALTAMRLQDQEWISVPSRQQS